jgi:hypothetical protein
MVLFFLSTFSTFTHKVLITCNLKLQKIGCFYLLIVQSFSQKIKQCLCILSVVINSNSYFLFIGFFSI